MTTDYKTLLKRKAELDAQIAHALKLEKGGAIDKVRELIVQYQLRREDIFGGGARKASVGVAKYRNPATGATWTGRGKPPRWIEGKDRTVFEI